MKFFQVGLLALAVAGMAFAADVSQIVPEIGIDGPTVGAAIGLLAGGLLIVRARRK